MSDPRQPETAAMIRAIKAAERLGGRTDRTAPMPPMPRRWTSWNTPWPPPNARRASAPQVLPGPGPARH